MRRNLHRRRARRPAAGVARSSPMSRRTSGRGRGCQPRSVFYVLYARLLKPSQARCCFLHTGRLYYREVSPGNHFLLCGRTPTRVARRTSVSRWIRLRRLPGIPRPEHDEGARVRAAGQRGRSAGPRSAPPRVRGPGPARRYHGAAGQAGGRRLMTTVASQETPASKVGDSRWRPAAGPPRLVDGTAFLRRTRGEHDGQPARMAGSGRCARRPRGLSARGRATHLPDPGHCDVVGLHPSPQIETTAWLSKRRFWRSARTPGGCPRSSPWPVGGRSGADGEQWIAGVDGERRHQEQHAAVGRGRRRL